MAASEMDNNIIAEYFKKSKQNLQSEHDSMIENVKNDIYSFKKKALSNAYVLADIFLLSYKRYIDDID